MEFEVRVEKGPASEPLAREQAAAIRQVLAWIARKQSGKDEPDGSDTGS